MKKRRGVALALASVLCVAVVVMGFFALSPQSVMTDGASGGSQPGAVAPAADDAAADGAVADASSSAAATPVGVSAEDATTTVSQLEHRANAANDAGASREVTVGDGSSCVANQVMLSVSQDMAVSDLTSALAGQGVDVNDVSLVSNNVYDGETLVLLDYAGDQTPADLAAQLVAAGVVSTAEPNFVMTLCDVEDAESATPSADSSLAYAPNDSYLAQQWGLYASKAEGAWNVAKTSGSVTVVVIDSGVDYDHADLADNLILGDYVKNTFAETTGVSAVDDKQGHGTHVAGIISAVADNGVGVAGISFNAKVLSIKAYDDETGLLYDNDLIEAIDYVIQLKNEGATQDLSNIRVINMSLGGTDYGAAFEAAVAKARSAGILVVAAAGNESTNVASYPAAYEGAMGVSALTESDDSTYGEFDSGYSNYGSYVDIAAPGSTILSTYIGNRYARMSGTSMAAPMVAGAAALVYSLDPTATPDTVESVLEGTAQDLGDAGRDDLYGYGALDLCAAVCTQLGVDVSDIDDQPYTGLPLTPAVNVQVGDYTLQEGTDYTVTYADNTAVGTATVTVTFVGDYVGLAPVVREFAIVDPASPTPGDDSEDPAVTVVGRSILLSGSLGMSMLLAVPDEIMSLDDACLQVTDAEGAVVCDVPLSSGAKTGTYEDVSTYAFTGYVAALCVADDLTIHVTAGGENVPLFDADGNDCTDVGVAGSVASRYGDTVAAVPAAQPLLSAMLFYGANCQVWFDHQTDHLASSVLQAATLAALQQEADALTADDLAAYRPSYANTEAVKCVGGNVAFGSTVSLLGYFEIEQGEAADYVFSVDGVVANATVIEPYWDDADETKTYVCVTSPGILAQSMDVASTFTVTNATDGSTACTLKYSALGYVWTCLAAGDTPEAFLDVCRSMRVYNTYAKQFVLSAASVASA